jgi:hypothetical protein
MSLPSDPVDKSEVTECQHHTNCGAFCETRREVDMNLCADCLEAHDEDLSGADHKAIAAKLANALRELRCAWLLSPESTQAPACLKAGEVLAEYETLVAGAAHEKR